MLCLVSRFGVRHGAVPGSHVRTLYHLRPDPQIISSLLQRKNLFLVRTGTKGARQALKRVTEGHLQVTGN